MLETLNWLFFDVLWFGGALVVGPVYLLSFTAIAWMIYIYRGRGDGFFAWLLPSAIYKHRSIRADVALFSIGQVLQFFGLFARFAATPAVAAFVAGIMPFAPFGQALLSPLWLALILFTVNDFALYWSHRWYHNVAAIWPLHAVHHSAEVLSPITAYRQHPVSTILSTSIQTFIVGTLYGVLIGALDPEASIVEIAGINAFIVIANLTLTNFQHSHIWISFGPVLERIFISPAQHQVHHSTDPTHFNKNFGQTFAIWDWMFGSLYLTSKDEKISFGLNDKADAPLMTHRLGPILIDPLKRMLSHAKGQ